VSVFSYQPSGRFKSETACSSSNFDHARSSSPRISGFGHKSQVQETQNRRAGFHVRKQNPR
jgi:hypothetical protein